MSRKITVKKFCEMYNKQSTDNMKAKYLKDHLSVNNYIPFVTKDALINNLLKITMTDKETRNVKVNSIVEHLLLTRIFIENYTNLTVETEGFFEEYDELRKSGLYTMLFVGTDDIPPLIPYDDMSEFKYFLNLKKNDIMTNKYEIHSFITEQLDRFKTLGEATLSPIFETLNKKLEDIPKDEISNKIISLTKMNNFKEIDDENK